MKWIEGSKTNHYTSIDTLPIWNWVKIHEANDLSYLIKGDDRQVKKKQIKVLDAAWKRIYDEYIKRYGFNQAMLTILRKQKQITKMKVEYWTTGDRTLLTFIEINQRELDKMIESTHSKENFFASKPWMEKLLGFRINIHHVSVAEWMDYAKTCEQLVKKQAA